MQKLVVATNDGEVRINREIDCSELMPSNTEQGDEITFVHVLHSAKGNPRIQIKTVDSDL